MFFTPEHISKIISGAKTQTRRIVKPGEILHGGPFTVDGTKFYETPRAVYTGAIPHERLKWMVGRDYAVSPGRGKPGVWWYPATRTWVHPSDDQRATGPGYAGSLPLRIRLLAIRQEALQDISEEDARAEGCETIWCPECGGQCYRTGTGMMADPNDPYGEPLPYPIQVECSTCAGHGCMETPREVYALLWDSINTRKGTRWDDDQQVWVLTFEVVR